MSDLKKNQKKTESSKNDKIVEETIRCYRNRN
jgi:hypothetical protein